MNTQSKKRGKNANRKTAVPDIAGQEARDAARAEIPEEAPIESQKTADEECPFIDQPAAHPETDVRLLDLNKIVNSTYKPRKNFREDTLLELAESIKQSGVLQPICVRPRDEGFEIVYGERRYWAAAMANLKFIPALVRDLSDALFVFVSFMPAPVPIPPYRRRLPYRCRSLRCRLLRCRPSRRHPRPRPHSRNGPQTAS